MFWVKVHKTPNATIVTVVDEELMGKEFREGEVVLKIDEYFFKGERVEEDIALRRMEGADVIYVIGERAVRLAQEAGLIHPMAVKRVKGIPHAQTILIEG